MSPLRVLLFLALGLSVGHASDAPAADPAPPFLRCAASTVHPLATRAALESFDRGGNAVDAAIAAAAMLGVVDSHNSGLGGGCFLLVRAADGSVTVIDGRENAPAAAHRDLFVRDGAAVPDLSRHGALAVATPGALAAWDLALRRLGRRSLADALLPAAIVAEEGFPIDSVFARKLAAAAPELAKFPASAAIFLSPTGEPLQEGDVLVQPDLATTLRTIATDGPEAFYRGKFAHRCETWMRDHGGILTAADFAAYAVIEREPVRTLYRTFEIVGFPPPSSGGVHVAQMLHVLEPFPIPDLAPAAREHVLAETMKLAFADRSRWLGDPAFTPVPVGLIDPAYGQELSRRIDLNRAMPVPNPGTPPRAGTDVFGKHTQHLVTADAAGNWVSLTSTINTAFGSKVVIPGTGVLLNNEMDDFAAAPGAANAFGLVGAEANAVAPGKRPLSSMSPTLVLRDGVPILAVGAAGGPTIITQTLQFLVNHLDLGLPPDDALARPRLHHQWEPDELRVEDTVDPAVAEALRALGHPVTVVAPFGATQCIVRRDDGAFLPVHDPRVPGASGGR
jgi:gamma-glutamyltranspeptidase/glutathione hydrolase